MENKMIKDQLDRLDELVKKHPVRLPIGDVAKLLGMDAECLRAALMSNSAPFGFGYQMREGAYRSMVIPTVPFYLWYTNGKAVVEV